MKFLKIIPIIVLLLVSISCNKHSTPSSDFIVINDNHFELNGEIFYPMMLNYVVEYYSDDNDCFILGPHIDYDSIGYIEKTDPEGIYKQINAHLNLIKQMGFNTIRVCFDRMQCDEDGHYYYSANRPYYIRKSQDAEAIFKGLDNFLEMAKVNDLHVMLLIKTPLDNEEIEEFTIRLLRHCNTNSTLFAYDFVNEPLYFDPKPLREKSEVIKIVNQWEKMMDKYAPNQLFTIGFAEPIEVFEWDPRVLPVDFIQIHTYHPLRVCSEIYWYGTHANKPWMIGETGLPADNDSISYDEQLIFMREVYQYARDAGACGFGWWEFQDIPSDRFEAAYTGLLNHEGRTITEGYEPIYGTQKPACFIVDSLLKNYTPRPLKRPVNYYNMLGYNNIKICGKIINAKNEQPIEDAVVRGWNDDWSIGMNTYCNADGYFELYCNQPCNHFEISAPGMERVKFDNNDIKFQPTGQQEKSIDELSERGLEYHSINYQPFIKPGKRNQSTIDFDSTLFNQAKYEGSIGTVKLKKVR